MWYLCCLSLLFRWLESHWFNVKMTMRMFLGQGWMHSTSRRNRYVSLEKYLNLRRVLEFWFAVVVAGYWLLREEGESGEHTSREGSGRGYQSGEEGCVCMRTVINLAWELSSESLLCLFSFWINLLRFLFSWNVFYLRANILLQLLCSVFTKLFVTV